MVVVSIAVALLCCGVAAAQSVEEQGRAVLAKNEAAVITVQLVVKVKVSMGGMGSEEQESKQEAAGFIIDPSGLAVMALSSSDPSSMMDSMMSGMGDQFKMDTSLGEIKILLADGKELPAQVVLRDKDLDLAFLRTTEKPAQPLPFVDLSQGGEAQPLDAVVALGRLGKVANRATAVSLERIEAIVKKPRTLYVPGKDPTQSQMGSPVFTLGGKVLGIGVMRSIKDDSGGGLMGMMGGAKGVLPVVLPASDILEAAKQAPAEAPKEASAAEKPKSEEPKEKDSTVIIPNTSDSPKT